MSKTVNIGGDRLGSGNKMNVQLHGYSRSNHDLSYVWRSTMSPGTLVPFMVQVALPGDSHDIELNAEVMTHPTLGPLFGSYKLQLDVFSIPFRLYNSWLHNNRLGIGLDMSKVKLPKLKFNLPYINATGSNIPVDEQQINPSSLLAYLGIRGGIRTNTGQISSPYRRNTKMAIPYLAYWDIYKNYYSNKQEEIGVFIHNSGEVPQITQLLQAIRSRGGTIELIFTSSTLPYQGILVPLGSDLTIQNLPGSATAEMLRFNDTRSGESGTWDKFFNNYTTTLTPSGTRVIQFLDSKYENEAGTGFEGFIDQNPQIIPNTAEITLKEFPLENIDNMRDKILAQQGNIEFELMENQPSPYGDPLLFYPDTNKSNSFFNLEGLAVKTYQSDIFNNWINTEWLDGENGINTITAVDVSSGFLNLDSLNLAKKVYDMLNRIAISGGSYKDWLESVWMHEYISNAESPVYEGGLSKEIVFSEVVSNSSGIGEDSSNQPLGTLAGRGHLSGKHKGGHIIIRTNEPSLIMGIVSITPRIDYSQGNEWFTNLDTMDDLHKPGLDGIGFQELVTEQFAAWDTVWDTNEDRVIKFSAGKQPAWINYMTNYNRVYGNFAKKNNEMFMTLTRRFSYNKNAANNKSAIEDLTTYVQPDKHQDTFAITTIDAQNFWTQIAVKCFARRKMSAKIIPNL
ncbi:major capsid protein [Tortoise microvirus 14]|nr:major capsid protein [Tortoise microvirus 14]